MRRRVGLSGVVQDTRLGALWGQPNSMACPTPRGSLGGARARPGTWADQAGPLTGQVATANGNTFDAAGNLFDGDKGFDAAETTNLSATEPRFFNSESWGDGGVRPTVYDRGDDGGFRGTYGAVLPGVADPGGLTRTLSTGNVPPAPAAAGHGAGSLTPTVPTAGKFVLCVADDRLPGSRGQMAIKVNG
jgi:hypothetical protein